MNDNKAKKNIINELDSMTEQLSQLLVKSQDEMATLADQTVAELDQIDNEIAADTAKLKEEMSQLTAEQIRKGLAEQTENVVNNIPQSQDLNNQPPPTSQ